MAASGPKRTSLWSVASGVLLPSALAPARSEKPPSPKACPLQGEAAAWNMGKLASTLPGGQSEAAPDCRAGHRLACCGRLAREIGADNEQLRGQNTQVAVLHLTFPIRFIEVAMPAKSPRHCKTTGSSSHSAVAAPACIPLRDVA